MGSGRSAEWCGTGAGWYLKVYPDAREAGGSFRATVPVVRERRPRGRGDPERSRAEAARRARGQLRRYCVANGLNRLGTLTYAGEGCHDPQAIRRDLGAFFRTLRGELGGQALPYAWVPEWHKSGHGLHAHFAVGRYVGKRLIERAWGRGFVHIKLLGDLPIGSGVAAESRAAAGYLSKYVGKDFDGHQAGQNRYDVAEGFQPSFEVVGGRSASAALDEASRVMGGRPSIVWDSGDEEDWQGPPAVWASWVR